MLHLDLLSAVRFNSGLRHERPKPVAPPRCLLCLSRGRPIVVLTRSGWACGACTTRAVVLLQSRLRGTLVRWALRRRRTQTLAVVLLQSRWQGALVRWALRRRRTHALLATVRSQGVMAAAWRANLLARRQRAWRRWLSQQRRWSAMRLAVRWHLQRAKRRWLSHQRRRWLSQQWWWSAIGLAVRWQLHVAVRVWRVQAARRLGRRADEERWAHQLHRRRLAGAWGRWAEVARGCKGAEGAEAAARAISLTLLLLRGWHGLLAAVERACAQVRVRVRV